MKNICVALITCLSLFSLSCVSSKKLKSAQAEYLILEGKYNSSQTELNKCNDEKSGLLKERADLQQRNSALDNQLTDLNKQLDFMKQNNTTVLKQLQDLSVISASQAESIRKSLENIGAKDAYITDLQRAIASKDSLNMILVMNLKGAIGNLDDKDINIKVDKGVVYIDISDKMLFTSGKYEVTAQAKEVLGKVAAVLKNQPNIEFMVEGHTDNVPYRSGVLLDNWDLSVKRATAVVRILQNQYGLDPAKMTAAGRAEYYPVADNLTAENRSRNRRTRIVILPQLDQFFQLLEPAKK
jgi:chemotaxis protein MotB